MCGYFCNDYWFTDFMLKGKRLLDYTNPFSRNGYGSNDKKILNFFQWLKRIRWKTICCVISGEYRKFKNSKISYIFEKTSVLFIISVNAGMKMKNI